MGNYLPDKNQFADRSEAGVDSGFRDPIASPTALKSDSSIVRQSYRQHEYDMRGISTFLLFSFKLTEETLK